MPSLDFSDIEMGTCCRVLQCDSSKQSFPEVCASDIDFLQEVMVVPSQFRQQ